MKDDKLIKAVGKRIRQLRLSKKATQIQLAYWCDFKRQYMSRVEAGEINLTLKTLVKIADALDVSIHDLLPSDKETK